MKKVIVIVGPTASGKTALALRLAKSMHGEIINGDSVQIYRGLDIGSAKINKEEMQGIPHHMLDIADPKEPYSVYHFQRDVRKLIDQIDIPIIVGGTGLYIKAALYDYEFVESGRSLAFEKQYIHWSNEALYHALLKLDPEIKIDPKNRRRLLRALEQAILGVPRSQKTKKDELLYDAKIIYLDLDRSTLEKRLVTRLDQQIDDGFIDEVRGLDQHGIRVNAIGYRELAHYLDGKLTLEDAKHAIIHQSMKLAKKQKTFFKNQMHPVIVDALSETLTEDVEHLIDAFLKEEF